MEKNLTLGSLFSGSGGFELAGMLAGITPVWNSEIEPFPVAVTKKRLPEVQHYGDISALKGDKLTPVDIITFGSPCQDVSIAGKRNGLNGEKSSLFHQAVRVIKEMRTATNGKYPKFIVWENVTGVFSSDGGADFLRILEEICKIKDGGLHVPRPSGKWTKSGEILANDYSVAWRVLDAQYWGVPQRRKRVYLVADLGGQRAGKILFESEGVSGYSPQGFRAWQGTPENARNCVKKPVGEWQKTDVLMGKTARAKSPAFQLFENHSADTRYKGPLSVSPTISANLGTGGNNQPFVVATPKTLKIRCGGGVGGKGALIQDNLSSTLVCNNDQTLFQPKVYGICSKKSNSILSGNPKSGFYVAETARTLDTSDQSPNKNQGGMVVLEGNRAIAFSQDTYSKYSENEKSGALRASGGMYGGGSETLVYSTSKSSRHTGAKNSSEIAEFPQYTVRKLTPTECARLQGFPDWWCENLGNPNPSETEIDEWIEIFKSYGKPKSRNYVRKFLKNPHSDSAEYKMWGNAVALSCAYFVLSGTEYFSHNIHKNMNIYRRKLLYN